MKQSRYGISQILTVIIIAIIIVAIGLISIQFKKTDLPYSSQQSGSELNREAIENSQRPISELQDLNTLEEELQSTIVGEPELEVEELNSEASSL